MKIKVIRYCSTVNGNTDEYEQALNDTLQDMADHNLKIKDIQHLEQITADSKKIISTTYIKYAEHIKKMGRPTKY